MDDRNLHLFTLPTELFGALIDEVVVTLGIAAAVKLRLVCKMFSREIPLSICRMKGFEDGTISLLPHPRRCGFAYQYAVSRVLADGVKRNNLSKRLHLLLSALPDATRVSEARFKERMSLLVGVLLNTFPSRVFETLAEDTDEVDPKEEGFKNDCLLTAALFGIPEKTEEIIAQVTGEQPLYHRPTGSGILDISPLRLAAAGGHVQLVSEMIKAREISGCASLGPEVLRILSAAVRGGNEAIIRLVITLRRDWTPDWSLGAAIKALERRSPATFYLLCEILPVDLSDPHILAEAALRGHYEIVELCLANGADPHHKGLADWDSPIAAASYGGHASIVQLLISHGVDLNTDTCNQNPLTCAAGKGHKHIVEMLLSAGAIPVDHHRTRNPLNMAAKNGHAHVIEYLLQSGLDVSSRYKEIAEMALISAASYGWETIVRLFISYGVGKEGPNPWEAAMEDALGYDQLHIVDALIRLGAKPMDLRNTESWKIQNLPMQCRYGTRMASRHLW